jgi:PAS domain S-box-containing protein
MKTWRSWQAYCAKRYDILIVLGITFLVFSLSDFFNMYEWFTTKTRYMERWQIDEIPVTLLAFSLGCIWLLQRRARELAAEMTRRQHMAIALQESEARYRTVVEGSLQGMYIHQNDFIVRFANQALARLFGYDRAEALLGQEIWVLVAPHERTRLEGYSQACLRSEAAPSYYEWQGQHRDGTPLWLESLVSCLSWNGQTALLATVIDITARKQHDEERRKTAYEIHDGIAQLLVSAQQHLETCDALRQDNATLAQRYFTLGHDRLQRAIVETRRLMARLRPVPLETLGLIPAVQQYLEELGREAGWEVECHGDMTDVCLIPAQEAALFRIVQEALTNAWKHAQTSRMRIEFTTTDVPGPTLSMIIKDWGVGFQPAQTPTSLPRLGLLSMRDRARMLGGTCSIDSCPGQGTTVRVHIPLRDGAGI